MFLLDVLFVFEMLSRAEAAGAKLDALARRQRGPLQVGIFSRSFGRVVFSAEEYSRTHDNGPLAADGAYFRHIVVHSTIASI